MCVIVMQEHTQDGCTGYILPTQTVLSTLSFEEIDILTLQDESQGNGKCVKSLKTFRSLSLFIFQICADMRTDYLSPMQTLPLKQLTIIPKTTINSPAYSLPTHNSGKSIVKREEQGKHCFVYTHIYRFGIRNNCYNLNRNTTL